MATTQLKKHHVTQIEIGIVGISPLLMHAWSEKALRMMTGLYAVIATGNLVKRLVGLSLFQTSVIATHKAKIVDGVGQFCS